MNDKKQADFKIHQIRTHHEAVAAPSDGNLTGWIEQHTPPARFLLAHAFSGVVWGRREDDGRWLLSNDLLPGSPPLNLAALLHLRAFSETAELYLWRDGRGLHARLTNDTETGKPTFYYDESQILWGSRGQPLDGGFTRLEDGEQGLVHAVPIPIPDQAFASGRWRPARLHLRHYIVKHKSQDKSLDSGLARISHSRLRHVDYEEKNDGPA